MGWVALAIVATLLIALAVGLAYFGVSMLRLSTKATTGLRSARGFAAIAESEGWSHNERDEFLPESLSPLLPDAFDNTVAVDVLRGHVQGRDVLIFSYQAVGGGDGSLSVWAARLPHFLPPFSPADEKNTADQEYAHSLSRLAAFMNAQEFGSWRIQDGFLQAWRADQKRDPRRLLTRLEPVVQAIEEIPPETWQKYGQ